MDQYFNLAIFQESRRIILLGTDLYVTGFGKTDHNVTIDILRNTDLKY